MRSTQIGDAGFWDGVSLARYLGASERNGVVAVCLDQCRRAQTATARVDALVGVASLLDSADRQQIADVLVRTFAEFDEANKLVDGIVAALPVLSEAQRTRWIAEGIDAALAVPSVFDRAPLVTKLLPHLRIAEAGRWHQLWSEALYLVARRGREELLEAVSLLIKTSNPGHEPSVFAAMAHEIVTVFEWFP